MADDDTTTTTTDEDDTTTSVDDAAAGKVRNPEAQALAQEAAGYRRRAKAAEAEIAKLKAAQQTEAEKAISEAVKAEREKVSAEYEMKLLAADVRAAAAGRLADPADAGPHVDLAALAELDAAARPAAIRKAIDELLEAKPYLAGNGGDNGGGDDTFVSAGARSTPRTGDKDAGKDPDAWLRGRLPRR